MKVPVAIAAEVLSAAAVVSAPGVVSDGIEVSPEDGEVVCAAKELSAAIELSAPVAELSAGSELPAPGTVGEGPVPEPMIVVALLLVTGPGPLGNPPDVVAGVPEGGGADDVGLTAWTARTTESQPAGTVEPRLRAPLAHW